MQEPTLYSIQQARKLLGGISRNTIYQLLRTGQLASVVIGCRRFISRAAIDELIARSTTTVSPSRASTRSRLTGQAALPLPMPSLVEVGLCGLRTEPMHRRVFFEPTLPLARRAASIARNVDLTLAKPGASHDRPSESRLRSRQLRGERRFWVGAG
jgi:excisionase family DNA binding protein